MNLIIYYGGIIFDYLSKINVGLIEYIAVSKEYRKKGIATKILNYMVYILNKESKKKKLKRIKFICGEVEKDFGKKQEKHYFWDKYGFKKLDFKYIQPALDENKKNVEIMTFGIMTKIPNAEFEKKTISSSLLKEILYEYYGKDEKAKAVLDYMSKEIDNKGSLINLIN